jgi:hypothetical protein
VSEVYIPVLQFVIVGRYVINVCLGLSKLLKLVVKLFKLLKLLAAGYVYIEKGYASNNINILSDSSAAIKALYNFQINSKLLWDCHQSWVKLAEHNRIQLVWVP